ncbi:MAG: type IV secretory system conjugative DNA transfer family protein, partial [Roseibium sp.]
MTPSKLILLLVPVSMMIAVCIGLKGSEAWLAQFGSTVETQQTFGRFGIAIPYGLAAGLGIVFLFAARGAMAIRFAGYGVLTGAIAVIAVAATREFRRLSGFADTVPAGHSLLEYADPSTGIGAILCFVAGMFAFRVALSGDAAFATMKPRRMTGKRAIHGSADWMSVAAAKNMFCEGGGIVLGEAYRVDQDSVANQPFRADFEDTWGNGGKSSLLCFDASFGSTHGLVFAGSGGFKTTSVTIPTALKWGGGLVALDPSNEAAPMVIDQRRRAGHEVFVLSPKDASVGFNVLDWIGRFGGTKEEDVVAVASWVVTDTGRQTSMRDDFFRASALQLITALIADVCLSGHTEKENQTLRQMRMNLSEPEPKLRERLQR